MWYISGHEIYAIIIYSIIFLQKYRLYLKRISNVASQANLVAALGSKDPSYMRYGSLDGYGDFRALTGVGKLSTTSLSSYPPGGMLGRLNTPAGLGFRGISSSGLPQPSPSQNSGGSAHYMGQLQSQGPINTGSSLFQGIPTKLEVSQIRPQNKLIGSAQELNGEDPITSRLANKITDQPMTATSSGNNSLPTVMSNHLLLQNNRIKPSVQMGGLHLEPADVSPGSSGLVDQSRCNDIWSGCTIQNSKFASISSPMPLIEPLNNFQLPLNGNFPLPTSQVRDNQIDFSSSSAVSGCFDNSRHDIPCQGGWISTNNYTVQNVSYGQNSRPVGSIIPAGGFVGQNVDHQGTAFCSGSSDASLVDSNMRSDNYVSEQTKTQDDFFQGPFEPLDELMDAVIKRVSFSHFSSLEVWYLLELAVSWLKTKVWNLSTSGT